MSNIKQEAEEKYPVNIIKMDKLRHLVDNPDIDSNELEREAFIAGAASRFAEQEKIKFAIEVLRDVRQRCHFQEARIFIGSNIKELEASLDTEGGEKK